MLCGLHQVIFFALFLVLLTDGVYGGSTCDPVEGYYVPNGEDYRGHVNVTEMGIPCRKWSEQHLHLHDTPVSSSLTGVGDHNYCRNPNGLERPGCFTMNPSIQYQFCVVGPPCNWPPLVAILQFEPPSGTHLRINQPVKIVCYPRPCQIYYTLDDSIPTNASASLYSRPIVLTGNATVKVVSLFPAMKILRGEAVYTLPPLPAPTSAYFSPLPSEVLHGPVLVLLKGLKVNDGALIFKNEALRGSLYEGPFWLNESTNVTAVINREHIVRASYVFTATGIPVEMYPVSGKYIGGVSCLVYQADPKASYAISVNNSVWQPLTKFAFIMDTVGTNLVGVRSTSLGGLMNVVWRRYEVVEAVPPLLLPAPDVVYTQPIRVTCKDPMGRALRLEKGSKEEFIFAIPLDAPGRFSVNCTYVDDLHHARVQHAVYELQSTPLPRPFLLPTCGRSFPKTPLLLVPTMLPPPEAGNKWDLSRLRLKASSTGAILQRLLGGHSYLLRATQTRGTNVTVTLLTSSSSPLEADSPPLICQYEVLPLGSSATPWFVGRPESEDHPGWVSVLLRQLASCLSFGTGELIFAGTIGPFVMIQLQRLPTSLRMEYYTRTGDCLRGGLLADLRNETSGLMQLARRWTAQTTSSSLDVATAIGITVVVEGWGLDSGEFHLVRQEFPCKDLGIRNVARKALNLFSVQLLFVVDTPGTYKLCASLNNALYIVPSDGPLTVNPSQLPVLNPTPCGGPSKGPIDVAAHMTPQAGHSYLFFSIDAALWHRVEADAVVHVAPLTASITSTTLAVTAGQRYGASAVCVFYLPRNEVPQRVTYKWGVTSIYEGRSNIVLAVNGSFSGESRVELRAYRSERKEHNDSALAMGENMLQSSVADFPFFTSLGTCMGPFTVSDQLLTLVGGAEESPIFVVASVDGISLHAEPLTLALSPLAISMYSCKNCTSGWCFRDECVCVGETNRTAYFCVEKTLPPSTPHSNLFRLELLVYLLVLGAICSFVGLAIHRGNKRLARQAEGESVR
ncbi:putative hepatocyte growth factor-like [Trypanosoma rangeli]|uniref:Putative hepatocyte growth factor-like n=1 Tax=Trypanosoma rangeli TaxID=5698 RepID=A0A3R7MRE1_TRYRA|nr:putative hepatocyte growth factor-like [Trypanosoma rangeli]RNF10029.1 putative hepatocyte growth factor-like [Trypanosoma rangeli]|eukprot:RNF10029.1 putative hepatocyte growth factor-like [Trypanosoma rangeli]